MQLACSFEAFSGQEETVMRKPKHVNSAKSVGPVQPNNTLEMQIADLCSKYDTLLERLSKPQGGGAPTADSECFYCHGRGHFANTCPNKRQSRQGNQQTYKEYRNAANAALAMDSAFPEDQNTLNR